MNGMSLAAVISAASHFFSFRGLPCPREPEFDVLQTLTEGNKRLAETEIKGQVIKGLFWKISENFGAQGLQFVISILLARLLTPAE